MRRTAFAALLAVTTGPALADPATYVIDREHTVVAFLVKHIGYASALGRFTDISGSFTYDDETQTLSDLTVTLGATSVDSDNDARDGHVRGKDFLNAEAFPDITFTADSGTPSSDTTGTVEGTLNLLGQALPLTLDVTLNKMGPYPFGHKKETIGVSARGTVIRSAFGMTYGVSGDIVGDAVQVIIEMEAIRQD